MLQTSERGEYVSNWLAFAGKMNFSPEKQIFNPVRSNGKAQRRSLMERLQIMEIMSVARRKRRRPRFPECLLERPQGKKNSVCNTELSELKHCGVSISVARTERLEILRDSERSAEQSFPPRTPLNKRSTIKQKKEKEVEKKR